MKQFKWYFSAILAVMTLLFSGCEIFREALEESYSSEDPSSEEFEARFNIGVFQIVKYPRAAVLEKIIDIGNGETLCVNTNALFSSKGSGQRKLFPVRAVLIFTIWNSGSTAWARRNG